MSDYSLDHLGDLPLLMLPTQARRGRTQPRRMPGPAALGFALLPSMLQRRACTLLTLLRPAPCPSAQGGKAANMQRRLYKTLSTELPDDLKQKLMSLLAAEFSKKVGVVPRGQEGCWRAVCGKYSLPSSRPHTRMGCHGAWGYSALGLQLPCWLTHLPGGA